ncbi:MAG: type IV secretory system conjugative DNA transfer family protein [Acidimicrobiales bacterium]
MSVHLLALLCAVGAVVATVASGTATGRLSRRPRGSPVQGPGTRAAVARGTSQRGVPGFHPSPPRGGRGGWTRPPGVGSEPTRGARWAQRRDLSALVVRRAPGTGRLVLGEMPSLWRTCHVVAERSQSVAVVGPTQSGKTTALAVPALLGWDGPVLAASVKTDLVRDTLEWRRRCGDVWCFDPARTTGLPPSSWSPVAAARSWPGARRVAADLTQVTKAEGTTADGEFWYATAAKLLAPLLFAAAVSGGTVRDVARWLDEQDTEEVTDILHGAGVPEALQAARATWLRDDRQRSAIYTTAETVLAPFAEAEAAGDGVPSTNIAEVGCRPDDTPPYGVPVLAKTAAASGHIDPSALLTGRHTLYLCAPAHDQRRFRALFVALVDQVLHAAFARASQRGAPLDPPLLVLLDEAANIAPLRDLDAIAATGAGHGIQLLTVWQDLAQVRARYGERAATVVNNHRAKLFLPGIADPATLDFASQLAGDQELDAPSVSIGARGERTVTTSPTVRRLLPTDALRRQPPGSAVLLYGSLPPAKVRLRPWFQDSVLAGRVPRTSGVIAQGMARRMPLQSRR